MDKYIKVYVELDVHKDSIPIAAAQGGRESARLIAQIPHDVNKLLKKLAGLGDAQSVHVVYEAGPTGYGLQRALIAHGYACEVIAPSLVPKRGGDRIKTDKRDSIRLAELSEAGELHAIWVPDSSHEALRDLARAREDAVNARTQMRHQLRGFLLRHGVRYPESLAWTKTFYRWLGTLSSRNAAVRLLSANTCWHLKPVISGLPGCQSR